LELSNIFVIHCIKASASQWYWGSYLKPECGAKLYKQIDVPVPVL
jgi:hypothetical protein